MMPPDPSSPPVPQPVPAPRATLCPYCGEVSADPARCTACRGLFEPLSRQASQNAMGPWFIRDAQHPFKPGCSFETLKSLIRRGVVTPRSIIRGPSTRQFWAPAERVPSVANLMGKCHACAAAVGADDESCPACGASFRPETDRQYLGLAPVRLLPGQATPEEIAAASSHPHAGHDDHHGPHSVQHPATPASAVPAAPEEPGGPGGPAPGRGWLIAGWVLAGVSTFLLAGLLAALLSGLDLPFLPGRR